MGSMGPAGKGPPSAARSSESVAVGHTGRSAREEM
jgi:hypothetical protein